jgi:hypothetical protein
MRMESQKLLIPILESIDVPRVSIMNRNLNLLQLMMTRKR